MNLIEITKGYEPKQNEQTAQMKNLPDITDKWKQLAKEQAEVKTRNEKKRAEMEIRKAQKEVKARTEKMRNAEYFWGMGYITVVLFAIIQNGAFQHDFIDFSEFHSCGMFDFVHGWHIRPMITDSTRK